MSDTERTSPAWTGAIVGAVIAGLVVGGVLLYMMSNQRRIYLDTLAEQSKRMRDTQAAVAALAPEFKRLQNLDTAQEILASLAKKDIRIHPLEPTSANPDVRGNILFDPSTTTCYVIATNFRPPAEGRTFQLWLLDAQGPIPAGEPHPAPDGHLLFTATPSRPITPIELLVTEESTPSPKSPTGPIHLRARF